MSNEKSLVMIVVFQNASNETKKYVVREFLVDTTVTPKEKVFESDEYEEVHAFIKDKYPYAVKLRPFPGDKPSVLETWV